MDDLGHAPLRATRSRRVPSSRLGVALGALLALLAWPSGGFAHVGAPEGRFPFVTSEGLVGGGTTWGIVLREGDRWLRVCEEALEEPPPFYYRRSDGRLLVARADGLWLTDNGCSIDPGHALFENRRPTLLGVPRERPSTLFIATSLSSGGNGLYISEDEGETFRPSGLVDQDVSFRSIAVSDDGSDVYLGAITLDTREPLVFVSRDGGETFAAKTPWDEVFVTANVVGLDPSTGEVALVLLDPNAPGSTLALADPALDEISTLAVFDGVISDFVVHDDAWLVIESRSRYYRRQKNEDAFILLDDGPTRCLWKLPGDERVWGCGQPFQDGHFLVSDDGISFTPEMLFLVVEEFRCPAGTIGAVRCAYLWETDGGVVAPPPDGGTQGEGPRVERPREELEEGCDCATASRGEASLLGLLSLAWLLGRRRPAAASRR